MKEGISANKILHHLDRVIGDHRPITADVFLDNYCNNWCGYCTYRRWKFEDGARSMSFDDFKRYADRLRDLGVLGIILTGGGEPTIAHDFKKIVTWLDGQDIKYGINTNFNEYVAFNPDYLKVSLDAWDEDSYYRTRGCRNYQKVRENIIRFAKYKTSKTNLGIQLIAKSPEEVNRFYQANKDLPVDYIVIRPVESTDGRYYAEKPDVENILMAIEAIKEIDDRLVLNFKWHLLDARFSECVGQWSQIAINEVGEVMYCCHKPYQIIGHIMDEMILEKKKLAQTNMTMCDVPCRLSSVNQDLCAINAECLNKEFI